jgi:hypothetical protein
MPVMLLPGTDLARVGWAAPILHASTKAWQNFSSFNDQYFMTFSDIATTLTVPLLGTPGQQKIVPSPVSHFRAN